MLECWNTGYEVMEYGVMGLSICNIPTFHYSNSL